MKLRALASIVLLCSFLGSCGDSGSSLGSEFDPLGAAGGNPGNLNQIAREKWKAGSYVAAAANSTPFFAQRPRDNSTAELLLPAGTMMRIVKADSSFAKVELDDGKVGYVAIAMIRQTSSAPNQEMQAPTSLGNTLPGELPHSSVGATLPAVDPSTGLPMPPVTLPGDPLPPSSGTVTPDALPPSSLDSRR
jgi:hypothetical protein